MLRMMSAFCGTCDAERVLHGTARWPARAPWCRRRRCARRTPRHRAGRGPAESPRCRATSCPELIASRILLLLSSIASTRRCPSIRVMGSTTTRCRHGYFTSPLVFVVLFSGFVRRASWHRGCASCEARCASHANAGQCRQRLADLVGRRIDARKRECSTTARRTARCPRSSLRCTRCTGARTWIGKPVPSFHLTVEQEL